MKAILMFEKKDDKGVILETIYLKGYKYLPNKATDGPLFTYDKEEAYVFETSVHAENVRNGDERITSFKPILK